MLVHFTDEQARVLINLRLCCEGWIGARACGVRPALRQGAEGNRWAAYHYELHDRNGSRRSLGRWSDEQAQRLAAYRATS